MTETPGPDPYTETTPLEEDYDSDVEDIGVDVVEAPGPNPYTENTTVEHDDA